MLTYRVFVSSTFRDLAAHRTAVVEGIRQLGAADIAMETFGARDERPKDECMRLIKAESDFFVGVYAHRYGFIPDGDDVSLTEAEYEAASAAGIPRLLYLVHEEAPWNPQQIELHDGRAKLQRFKQRLMARHICKFFSTPDDLRANVCADLGRTILQKLLPRVGSSGLATNGSEALSAGGDAESWNKLRDGKYQEQRGLFLAHALMPSTYPDQEFDILIQIIRHKSRPLDDIKYAEFFLGRHWRDKVFRIPNAGGPIGISVAAYGTFLCVCRVTFTDGQQLTLTRYIDFNGVAA